MNIVLTRTTEIMTIAKNPPFRPLLRGLGSSFKIGF